MSKKELISPGHSSWRDKVDRFMRSPVYILLVTLLAGLANAFGLELPVYTIYGLIVVYCCIWGMDVLPIMPLIMCSFLSVSAGNNPGKSSSSVLSAAGGGIYIGCIAAAIVIALIYRAIREFRRYKETKYMLLSGMLLLSAAYLLGGIGSQGYTSNAMRSIFFGFLNSMAIMLPYVVLSGNVRWDKTRKDYLVWIGFASGCLLLWEIYWIYRTGNVIENGVINRRAIYTGWGMYNNIGAILAMAIPFPFYLAAKHRQGWLGTLVASVFLVGVLLTCSRTSIICGCVIYFVSVLLMLIYAKDWKASTFTLVFFSCAAIAVLYFYGDQIKELFSALLDKGLDSSDRDEIYAEGIKLFSRYPILGGSFFSPDYMPWAWSTNEAFNSFFPPRWHNTYIQLMASCGIVGLVTYAIHRWQTIKLFVTKRSPEKAFTACSLVVLLATSLFDCHFFNVGPAMLYSMALAFVEHIEE